jgi:competence protein CoiA
MEHYLVRFGEGVKMLRSRTIHGKDLFSVTCVEELARTLSRSNELHCPNCQNLVLYKKGAKKIAHFAHKPKTECVVSNYESETAEHLNGKQILFTWLTSKFPSALVELEVYITETEQIADVLVTHASSQLQGQRWAFEFQHSPLSEAEWKKRHALYQEAEILDFWFFDADVFLQYSQAQEAENARRFREPIKAVFEETGFTYFLDIASEKLTVDCKFYVRSIERRISARGGMIVENDYTFHDPLDHSEDLSEVMFHYHKEERYAAIFFSKISSQFESKFTETIQEIKRKKLALLYKKRRDRFNEIIAYCAENISDKHSHLLKAFCLQNKPLVADDLLASEIPAFIEKYRLYVEKIILYLEEFDLIRESDKVVDKVVADQAPLYQYYENLDEQVLQRRFRPIGDIYEKKFIEEVDSFSYVLYERYAKAIGNVEYVIERYSEELEKLLLFRQSFVENKLSRINHKLDRRFKEPSVIGYALGYAHCESHEEIDELVRKVKEEIIDYDPFKDIDFE